MSIVNRNYVLQPCPCCGSKVLSTPGEYEICELCGWEDDPIQSSDPDYAGGANKQSLNEAKKEWSSKKPKP
jgi:anaerobic ribonucleoside-triphosphate reductase